LYVYCTFIPPFLVSVLLRIPVQSTCTEKVEFARDGAVMCNMQVCRATFRECVARERRSLLNYFDKSSHTTTCTKTRNLQPSMLWWTRELINLSQWKGQKYSTNIACSCSAREPLNLREVFLSCFDPWSMFDIHWVSNSSGVEFLGSSTGGGSRKSYRGKLRNFNQFNGKYKCLIWERACNVYVEPLQLLASSCYIFTFQLQSMNVTLWV